MMEKENKATCSKDTSEADEEVKVLVSSCISKVGRNGIKVSKKYCAV